jgi:hypothetical protein
VKHVVGNHHLQFCMDLPAQGTLLAAYAPCLLLCLYESTSMLNGGSLHLRGCCGSVCWRIVASLVDWPLPRLATSLYPPSDYPAAVLLQGRPTAWGSDAARTPRWWCKQSRGPFAVCSLHSVAARGPFSWSNARALMHAQLTARETCPPFAQPIHAEMDSRYDVPCHFHFNVQAVHSGTDRRRTTLAPWLTLG